MLTACWCCSRFSVVDINYKCGDWYGLVIDMALQVIACGDCHLFAVIFDGKPCGFRYMGFTSICRICEKMQLAGIQDYRRSVCHLRSTFFFNGDI